MVALDHRNILKPFQIFESQNSIYIQMEHLEGSPLSSKVKNGSRLFSRGEVQEFMFQILKALKHMAKRGIMHRDLKAQNLMFRSPSSNELVLIDFGLSSPCDSHQYFFKYCGTPGQIAPEIFTLKEGSKLTPKVDVFSAGVLFYLMYQAPNSASMAFQLIPGE